MKIIKDQGWAGILLALCIFPLQQVVTEANSKEASSGSVLIIWNEGRPEGVIKATDGNVENLRVITGRARINGTAFRFNSPGEVCLEVTCSKVNTGPGSGATLIHLLTARHPFSFYIRDVDKEFPVYIPEYGAIVTEAGDQRGYDRILSDIKEKGLELKLEKIEQEPEYSFDRAASITLDQQVPTWLGVSRDIRLFTLNFARKNEPAEMGIITPKMAANPVYLAGDPEREINYGFVVGRGVGPVMDVKRSLEQGFLPILHTDIKDEDISYLTTCFVSLERSRLVEQGPEGTNYLVADSYCYGNMFTKAQESLLEEFQKEVDQRKEETLFCFRAEACNTSEVPRYAWFKTIRPGRGWWDRYQWKYDPEAGFSLFGDGTVFGVSRLNGKPMPQEEIAVQLMPGEKIVFEFYLPHRPLPVERAKKLYERNFDARYIDCRDFWMAKTGRASTIRLPEKRIQDMMNAGLLHLDLVTYGCEPGGTLAPAIGVYSPIGTESAPIIQYFNSRGWAGIAERSIRYFLEKQHEDGLIQNFGGYMIETGAALWTMGEYFRYTRDTAWLIGAKEKLMLSGRYLKNWREDNMIDSLKGKGFGMISGRVADPADDYHQFMLNAYGYLGLSRLAEMLNVIDPEKADIFAKEAASWKSDIRESLFRAVSLSPVVPLGDGSWSPTVPPWPESKGLQALFVEPGNTYSHGTFTARDVMLGPLYLVFCGILDPQEDISGMMLKYHTELLLQNNTAFSQPYYSRHAWLELKKDMVKPFLKTYYTTFSALADRETYTFWEHLYHVSSHKTHEEAWFLMQSRWMLYMEEGDTLKMLRGIPRVWLSDGEQIVLKNAATYFGPVNLEVNSVTGEGYIEGRVSCGDGRSPSVLVIRIPHPDGIKPVRVTGGRYDITTESVYFESFSGEAHFRLDY